MTTQSVCLVLTRPLWQGAPDILADELQAAARTSLPAHWSLRVVSAPLQRLIPLTEARYLPTPLPTGEGRGLLVATSPASVEALLASPEVGAGLGAEIAKDPGRWVLTGVGEASVSALEHWFQTRPHAASPGASGRPEVWRMPTDLGSGAEPFLQWLSHRRSLLCTGTTAVLLEAQENQPVLAEGLASLGIPTQRLRFYRRVSCPMPMIAPRASEVVGLVISSSTVVDAAIAGLRAQAVEPLEAVWMTHHPRIAQALTAALGIEITPLLEGLSALQILSGMARLNFRV
ncbi:MAG: uroporphyrinogen-III synthase [Burkholderiaceae bacterium]